MIYRGTSAVAVLLDKDVNVHFLTLQRRVEVDNDPRGV